MSTEELRYLYVDQMVDVKDLAQRLDISEATLYRRLKKYNISRTSFRGCGDLPKTAWTRIVNKAAARNIEVEICIEDAWNLFQEQGGRCALSGLEIKLGVLSKDRTASLDRKDCSKPYTRDNVQWVHKQVNIMKNTLSDEEFIYFCKEIARNN